MSLLRRASREQQQNPQSPLGKKIWDVVRKKHQFAPLTEQSLQHLATANELLLTQALVVYINHTLTNDALVAISLILAYLTNARRFAGPAGMRHYDFSRDPKNALLLRALKAFNMHALPVVQHNDRAHYSEEKIQNLIIKLKEEAQKILTQPRSIYGIAPEGTRNQKDGTVAQARPGIGKLNKFAPNLVFLPLAIAYPKFSDTPQVVIGKPQTTAQLLEASSSNLPNDPELKAQLVADLLLFQLSLLLPQELRGYYSNFK